MLGGTPDTGDIPPIEWRVLDDAMGVLKLEIEAQQEAMEESENPGSTGIKKGSTSVMAMDSW